MKHSLFNPLFFMSLSLLLFFNVEVRCSSSDTLAFTKVYSVAEKQFEKQDGLQPIATMYPRTSSSKGEFVGTKLDNWTEGFFPGCLWFVYENNKQDSWKQLALKWTLPMEKLQFLTSHHDVGFLMNCSYGNAYRLTKDEKYKDILVQSAKSLCTRFSEKTGCIKSWNSNVSWDGKHKWFYPVIIDNMINIELLYLASELTGDQSYAKIATTHAETTAKNQFRPDFSSYHVVNYDPASGAVLFKGTCQGFADNSTWARGQAWSIYGYTMAYRFTKRKDFLELAKKLAGYWLNNSNMPEDGIPYWDFNAGQKNYEAAQWCIKHPAPAIQPRDASAAAVSCSALFELSTYIKNDKKYYNAALKMLKSLSSPAYLAETGSNSNFLLKHSTGNLPQGSEIDVPLVYADYYYLEALSRYKKINAQQKL